MNIRSGVKSNGRIFTYIEGMAIRALPRALRLTEASARVLGPKMTFALGRALEMYTPGCRRLYG